MGAPVTEGPWRQHCGHTLRILYHLESQSPAHAIGKPRFNLARLCPGQFPHRLLREQSPPIPGTAIEHHLVKATHVLCSRIKPTSGLYRTLAVPKRAIN